MQPATPTMMQLYHSRGNSWPARLVKSNWFACAISILLHGTIFIVLYQTVVHEAVQSQRHIIPEAWLAAGPPIQPSQSILPLQLSREPATPPADMNKTQLDELPKSAITFGETLPLEPTLQPEGSVDLLPWGAISETAAGSNSNLIGITGNGGLRDDQSGLVYGSISSLFGESGKGGLHAGQSGLYAGPASSFFGAAGNAYKVVYVVDTSASLMIYIDEIVQEMRQSISGLLPMQRFHIVLAKPGEVVEFSPRRLVPANGTYKSQAMDFIDGIGGIPQPGKADPIEAMRRAFAVQPELIYFLTDGDYPDIQEALERTLAQLNPQQATRITTIGFDPSPVPRALLERMAKNHGGNFRMVVLK